MIRDKSAKKLAKDTPKKDGAKKAAPANTLEGKPPQAKSSETKASEVQALTGKSAGRKGIIAVAPPSFRRERALIKRGVWPVAGCDEAGRGPLAGPVVAAAVILDPDRIPRGIDDSKRLTAEEREKLFDKICATAQVSVAVASPARIDRDNILRASLWALKRAVVALPEAPRHVFVDGRDRLDTECDCEAVIGGDGIVLSIAAASIVAKVTRDRLMCALAQDCPGYGFEQHKGYAVPEHLDALDRLGPSIHHRSFFAPVAAARAKHMPWTVEPAQDLFSVAEVEVQVEAQIEIDASANL
ncbi:ribonuclease HII [Bradyrhizobium sp. 180]|uniref:ribonuclease HII n=1 Tax=unclassified Bradyrhizobium TaxID=2631580 RepID=UPI001FFAC295|nr:MULTISPECIES: ribonuclease HII [unclassified Bradyrhizobium]MCK1423290.1 ribonuclease HII [Bradyrhizobium sp. CW12]MCK1493110.1 ribonuclease HII [Bradyrhizobium sp. 180]MCK1531414.1 ribonuclease HII [Bradyrhizobium sp. 182]MCK1598397.1 ribonuclease HII [Bradyrhizobium sp. 164]MCK1617888.1 ribonuclease HII [Bradyrhizobium sp. 159]